MAENKNGYWWCYTLVMVLIFLDFRKWHLFDSGLFLAPNENNRPIQRLNYETFKFNFGKHPPVSTFLNSRMEWRVGKMVRQKTKPRRLCRDILAASWVWDNGSGHTEILPPISIASRSTEVRSYKNRAMSKAHLLRKTQDRVIASSSFTDPSFPTHWFHNTWDF